METIDCNDVKGLVILKNCQKREEKKNKKFCRVTNSTQEKKKNAEFVGFQKRVDFEYSLKKIILSMHFSAYKYLKN